MNKKHCVSLELSKALKGAGWNKPVNFFWYDVKFKDRPNESFISGGDKMICAKDFIDWVAYPAPLATEILEELPSRKEVGFLKIYKFSDDNYEISFGNCYAFTSNSLPDSIAEMWLLLQKEKIL